MPSPLNSLFARISEINQRDWQAVTTLSLSVWLGSAVLILYFVNTKGWVFPLDNANLAFHEFGHPFFGLFSERLTVYGGTLGQLVFPITTIVVFWSRRETLSFALCWLWLFENFFNIARYMADARAMILPLVGGADPETSHDWREIFLRWGLLNADTQIAGIVRFIAWIGILAITVWIVYRWQQEK